MMRTVVVIEPSSGDIGESVKGGNGPLGEERGHDVSDHASNSVRRKDLQTIIRYCRSGRREETHIKAVVVVKQELELSRKVANGTRNNAKRNSRRSPNEPRRRRDRNKTRDRTGAEPNDGPLLLEPVVPNHPRQPAHARRKVSHNARLSRTQVRGKGRAAVEPEPAEPEEDCAEDDVGGVVGLVREALCSVAGALSEVDGNSQCGGSGGNVDGRAAGKVESAHDKAPAGGVPGPARDGIVDEGAPDKDEDCDGAETATLCETTEGEHGGDGGEHELVDAKDEGGDTGAAHRRLVEDALESKVLEVTDERAGTVGKGEGVAPEEPLEGYDGEGHHAKVDHAERILAAEQTRVEETDTGDHDPDERSAAQRPGDVSEVVHNGSFGRCIIIVDVVG